MDRESKRRKQKDRKNVVFLDSKTLLLCVVTIAAITINGFIFILYNLHERKGVCIVFSVDIYICACRVFQFYHCGGCLACHINNYYT